MTSRIEHLRARRAFYNKLGKRKKVALIDAELVPLVREELSREVLAEQVRTDIEWLAGSRAA